MKFSVLMSVYNKEKAQYLDECLQSLFDQTLKADEVVLVEDGPLSKELEIIIDKWTKKLQIISVKLSKNSGLAKALNEGLKYCSYDLIARMDTDDVCFIDRFEKQIKFFKNNPNIKLLGAQIVEYDEELETILGYRKVPLEQSRLRKFAKFRTAYNHVTVIFDKETILGLGGYSEDLIKMQDFALWGNVLSNGYLTANLDEVLVKVRTGENLFNRRTGTDYLKHELNALKYVKKYGLINSVEYYLIFILKVFTRLLPLKVLKYIYKNVLRTRKI
jgi:glycosyltransferase involved in cell wall biosynthesis